MKQTMKSSTFNMSSAENKTQVNENFLYNLLFAGKITLKEYLTEVKLNEK